MKQELSQEADLEPVPELSPEAALHLSPYLDTYRELLLQAKLIEDQLEIEKAKIWKEMELFDVKKCVLSGLRAAEHRGETTASLNKMKFVSLGGSLKILESATVNKPKKAYVKIELVRAKKERRVSDDES